VLDSGWVTTGREVHAFELEFAATVGAAHAVAVSSCTAGLELAFRSLQLRPGARVLVSTMTFCGAVHAILHAGLHPVLVDVDAVTGMPTQDTVQTASAACGGAEALCIVHWAGDPCDVEALAGLPLGLQHRPEPPDRHAWHLYPVRVQPTSPATRDEVIRALARHSIGTSVHFIPIHRLRHFTRTTSAPTPLTGAEQLFEQLVSLPMYPRLTDSQVDAVCLALEDTVGGSIGVRFS
jgi:dTDP-4-amino-4,6-dideoxygalactose transaminase